MQEADVVQIKCKIERVRHQRDLFAICVCSTKAQIPLDANVRGFSLVPSETREFVALGDGLSTQVGATVLLSGTWVPNTKFGGLQLRIRECLDYTGETREEVVAYLQSNALKGIGKKTAELIYDRFGADAMDIIATDPKQLLAIPGFKEKKLAKLVDSYEKNKSMHMLVRLLAPYDVTYAAIVRISKALGPHAASMVRDCPYVICSVSGFGFQRTDAIARRMGADRHDKRRIEGAITYALTDAGNSHGHLYLPRESLCLTCCSESLLNDKTSSPTDTISTTEVDAVIDDMLTSGTLRTVKLTSEVGAPAAEQRIYLAAYYTYEMVAAKKIASVLEHQPPKWEDVPSLVKESQKALGVTLDEKQEEAVINSLTSSISIITGGPGTGKTTTLNVLVHARKTLDKDERGILLAAPTGRAARRMSEQTGEEASTLHSLLGLRPDEWTDFSVAVDSEQVVDAAMLIVDESSMVDAHLAAELMYRVSPNTQLVFVGDIDQLPSVGPGNVLRQLLLVEAIHHVRLERVFRQDAGSVIPLNSKKIREGRTDLTYNRFFQLIPAKNEEEGAEIIRSMLSQPKAQERLSSIQILCPMRHRGDACTSNLNSILHDIVNPPDAGKAETKVGSTLFRQGDKVMQTRNIRGASNGDIGYICPFDPIEAADKDTFDLPVQFGEGNEPVEYDYSGAFDLEPATAITIHKSQGGEFPVVIVPMFNSMSFVLYRNVFYTAITRAKQQVIIIGEERAINTAIRKTDTTKRNTVLASLINEEQRQAAALGNI